MGWLWMVVEWSAGNGYVLMWLCKWSEGGLFYFEGCAVLIGFGG